MTNTDARTMAYPPHWLTPADIAQFVRTRIDRTTPISFLKRTEDLIDLYDVQEVTTRFSQFLDSGIRTGADDFARLCVFMRYRSFGNARAKDLATRYTVHLAAYADSNDVNGIGAVNEAGVLTLPMLRDLLSVYEAVGSKGDAQAIAKAIALHKTRAKSESPQDAQAVEKLLND